MRLHVRTPWFEGGNVLLPKEAPWLADYRRELLAFPKTKFDDQVDATTQALAWADEPRGEVAFHFAMCPKKEAFHRDLDSFMGSMGKPQFPGNLGW